MKKLLLSLFAFFAVQAAVQAQSTFGLHLDSFFPSGDLKQDSPELWGGGFSMEGLGQLNNSPIHVGGQLSFLRYGSEVRDGWHGPDLGDVRVRRNNELINLLGTVRIKPAVQGDIQPYVDFLTGFSYIYTRATYRDSSLDEAFASDNEFNDIAFNYGVGGGLEFYLGPEVSLDIRARALRGSRADYLTPRSVEYNTELEAYDMQVKSSRFDYFTFSIGIKAILFSSSDDLDW